MILSQHQPHLMPILDHPLLDANASSTHEGESQTPACQSSMEDDNDAVSSSPDNVEEPHEEEEGNESDLDPPFG